MKRQRLTIRLLAGLACCTGCAHPPAWFRQGPELTPPQQSNHGPQQRFRTASFRHDTSLTDSALPQQPGAAFRMIEGLAAATARNTTRGESSITPTVRLAVEPPEFADKASEEPKTPEANKTEEVIPRLPPPPVLPASDERAVEIEDSPLAIAGDVMPMDMQTAFALIGGQHPAVGFARWRVQQAYAEFDRARVMWIPTIQAGLSFHRHDGNYQASDGTIVDVNRNSFQYGLGNGATGAGTTPRPGVVAQFHLTDAIFAPRIAEKTAWASQYASRGVLHRQLLEASLAYLDLLQAHQDTSIVQKTRDRIADLAKLTSDFAASGQGLQADADRMQTELLRWETRLVTSRERIAVASANLVQTLSLAYGQRPVPSEQSVVPIELVSLQDEVEALISTGLQNRPELQSSQALVAAACHRYQREKYAPFVPSVLLGFSSGEFGGGLGSDPDNIEGRYDFDAALTWQARNLGLGEAAARRESAAGVQQSRFEAARTMDQIAREVSEHYSQVVHRAEAMQISQKAIQTARDSFDRNLDRIREGQGLPLEVLQSATALAEAQRAYLSAVVDYNRAQFQLQWALGWPVDQASLTPARQ